MSASHKILGLSPRELAGDLSPTQFELLVQAYITGHLGNSDLPSSAERYGMVIALEGKLDKSGKVSEWEWRIRDALKSDWAKAEIFAGIPQEFQRRKTFEAASKLLMIEGAAPIDSDPIDSIPF